MNFSDEYSLVDRKNNSVGELSVPDFMSFVLTPQLSEEGALKSTLVVEPFNTAVSSLSPGPYLVVYSSSGYSVVEQNPNSFRGIKEADFAKITGGIMKPRIRRS